MNMAKLAAQGPNRRALADLHDGAVRRWMWATMATQDIRLRYRGSVLGPLWSTLTTAIMVGAMGFVYAIIFKMDIASYLPFLTFGLIPWQFISSIVTEGCQTFIAAQPIMHQANIPLTTHVFRIVYRNALVVAHSLVIIVAVLFMFQVPLDWPTLLLLPACGVFLIDAIALTLILGTISARFRDVPMIVTNIMQILFFLTPILWPPETLGDYQIIAHANPLFAAIDIMRAPLLGKMPTDTSWPVTLLTTGIICGIAFILFSRFRNRIVFWV